MEREIIASYTRKDFRVTVSNGTGPGGQARNKSKSKVQIVHIPSGLSAQCDKTRSQTQNKATAFRMLAAKVFAWHREQEERPKQRNPETIRTYHAAENRVKDHASNFRQSYTEVERDIGPMLHARAAVATRP